MPHPAILLCCLLKEKNRKGKEKRLSTCFNVHSLWGRVSHTAVESTGGRPNQLCEGQGPSVLPSKFSTYINHKALFMGAEVPPDQCCPRPSPLQPRKKWHTSSKPHVHWPLPQACRLLRGACKHLWRPLEHFTTKISPGLLGLSPATKNLWGLWRWVGPATRYPECLWQ